MIRDDRRLTLPSGEDKILLHSCCAPCACEIMEDMVRSDLKVAVFFYNPNIFPYDEYLKRKEENIRFAKSLNVEFVDADYDSPAWFNAVQGFEKEGERGARCDKCFSMRLLKSAGFAAGNGYKIFTSSFGVSTWKDFNQVNAAGKKAAANFDGLIYWDFDWRTENRGERRKKLINEQRFYLQSYCGCPYSLKEYYERDS